MQVELQQSAESVSIYTLGLNHLAVRERMVFHVERLRDARAEVAILSTCNRTEFYLEGEALSEGHISIVKTSHGPPEIEKIIFRLENRIRKIPSNG